MIAVVVLGLVGWLAFSPAPIEPVAWSPPEPPALEGVFAPNRHLAGADRIATGPGVGPEDIVFDRRGRLYTGFQDGRILRLSPEGGEVAHVTSAVERAGRLYLGSAWESQLRVATLP